ncbi:sulfite exporter TauE/SafE family protein [Vibrio hippocampi]|uniref:Probable membrane transporter protein n=1 Tax=Vibrio hippocampi TaxID=654686 RepID=A0ABM8ZJ13_9VIBR|nr:sulfite exporter TauE/SafE family protein [Vibrio hippocampi]CAH0526796.1 hypothetical protein VHP8226_02172 [Vibrio hippocampi]
MNYELLILLLFLGSFVGLLSGLLGIGGGLVVVPSLVFLLPYFDVPPEQVMHVALATSLSTIIVTSGASSLNHLKLGNIDFFAIKWLIPGVILGGVAGSYVAEFIPHQYLPRVFAVIVLAMAIQMLTSIKVSKARSMPSPIITSVNGLIIGVVSSLAGIGGGSMSVPFLNRHGVEMRKAVGCSSFCGCLLAVAGMLGFVFHGFQLQNLPAYSVGYVYLPALLAIVATSVFTTRFGAKLATRLATSKLKKIFAVFLLFVSFSMML